MRTCIAKLKSLSPYSQSNFFVSEKGPKESSAAFEERCWREKAHTDDKGNIIIPPMAFKYAVDEACKRAAIQVPGEGKSRYTKYFQAGLMVPEPAVLGVNIKDLPGEWVWCSSTGKKGKEGGTRVRRCFPTIAKWSTAVAFIVLDDKITDEVFERCLREAGMYVGIGRYRPENQGYYGRFSVESCDWC